MWIASWGSAAGLRRVARSANGWLASAYNTSPGRFRNALETLSELLPRAAENPDPFPNALATTWLYVTEDPRRAEEMMTDVLAPMVQRPVAQLRNLALPIGPPEVCADRLTQYARAGAQRVFLWPLADDVHQLELFMNVVVPLVEDAGATGVTHG